MVAHLTASGENPFLDWANSINRRRLSVVELREIYKKADSDFAVSRLSGVPLVNPYEKETDGYFF